MTAAGRLLPWVGVPDAPGLYDVRRFRRPAAPWAGPGLARSWGGTTLTPYTRMVLARVFAIAPEGLEHGTCYLRVHAPGTVAAGPIHVDPGQGWRAVVADAEAVGAPRVGNVFQDGQGGWYQPDNGELVVFHGTPHYRAATGVGAGLRLFCSVALYAEDQEPFLDCPPLEGLR